MSQPLGQSQDPQAPSRKPTPRIREHAVRRRGLDPVSLKRHKPFFSPGNTVLLVFMAAFGLYATGHLSQLDRFFDRVQAFGRAHNDVVVRTIVHFLPAALVLTAAVTLGTLAFFALRDRFGRGRSSNAVDQKTMKAALANILRASAKRSSVETMAEMAVAAAAAQPIPAAIAARTAARHDPIEAARLRRDAAAAAAARDAAAGRAVVRPQPVLRRSLSDSMPTLPVNARVQRRNPRGTLPPQVAAALKVAAASTR